MTTTTATAPSPRTIKPARRDGHEHAERGALRAPNAKTPLEPTPDTPDSFLGRFDAEPGAKPTTDAETPPRATEDSPGRTGDYSDPCRSTEFALDKIALAQPKRRAAIERRAQDMPRRYRRPYIRAAAGTAAPRRAIRAFCIQCVCYERKEVALCTSLACPLWAYRQRRSARRRDG